MFQVTSVRSLWKWKSLGKWNKRFKRLQFYMLSCTVLHNTLSAPCNFPDFSHLGSSYSSHLSAFWNLPLKDNAQWNPRGERTRKESYGVQCISGVFRKDMGRVRLDLAGVHHDPDPLSHGLRTNKYEDWVQSLTRNSGGLWWSLVGIIISWW